MKTFTLDTFLALVRATVLPPWTSLLLPAGLMVSGLEPSPVKLGATLAASRWVNRVWNRKALNPTRKPKPDMKREIVVVTRGSTGIGAALVRKLDDAGATVVVLDVAPLSYKPGRRTTFVKCDISDAASVPEAACEVTRIHGAPTALVANAGIAQPRALLDASDESIRLTFGVNVLGLLWCVRAFVPGTIEAGRGHVLVTASAMAFMTLAGTADYSASKAAVGSLVEGLQTELKHRPGGPAAVAVSAVYPAAIATRMFEQLDAPGGFLMPVLTPDDVSARMCNILAEGQSEMAYMPASTSAQPWVRILPTWLRVGMQDAAAHIADKTSGSHK